jgi:hypothetical protein
MFFSSTNKMDGKRSSCKSCSIKISTIYNKKHPEVAKNAVRKYDANNKDKRKAYRDANKDKSKEYQKIYFQKNKLIISKRNANRRKIDIQYHLSCILRERLNKAVNGKYKSGSSIRNLGCSIDDLKIHIEKLFLLKMNWDNYGEWHIDHIIPLAKFDLTDPNQIKLACHYTNLQPLWAKDNLQKGKK